VLQKKKRKIPVSEKKRLAKERGLKSTEKRGKRLGSRKNIQAFQPIGMKLWFNAAQKKTQKNSSSSRVWARQFTRPSQQSKKSLSRGE